MSNNNSASAIALLLSAVEQNNCKVTEELLNEYGVKGDDKWNDYELLTVAVGSGNPKIIQLLLNHGCRVNKPRANAYSPLHSAVENDYVEIVKLLLEHGANPSAKWNDYTPLHLTINTRSVKVVKLLLEYKANVCAKDCGGGTAIHRAYQLNGCADILDLMLMAHEGKMKNSIDQGGMSIFHIVCTRNLPDLVEKFLQNKIDVHTRVNMVGAPWNGFTGLHFAGMYYQLDVIRVLLKYNADVNALCNRGLSALWMAVKYIFNDEIAYKLNKSLIKNKTSYEVVMKAQRKEIIKFMTDEVRNIQTIQLLLENNSDVNLVNKKGCPLLFEAYVPRLSFCFSDGIPNKAVIQEICRKYANKGRKTTMKMLINHGINVNVVSTITLCGQKGTLLHYIANNTINNTSVSGWMDVTEMILTNGGDANVKDSTGETALHKAVKIGFYDCVCLLLKYKANPNSTDNSFCTPLHYAKHEKIIKALTDAGANINAKDKYGHTPPLKVVNQEESSCCLS